MDEYTADTHYVNPHKGTVTIAAYRNVTDVHGSVTRHTVTVVLPFAALDTIGADVSKAQADYTVCEAAARSLEAAARSLEAIQDSDSCYEDDETRDYYAEEQREYAEAIRLPKLQGLY